MTVVAVKYKVGGTLPKYDTRDSPLGTRNSSSPLAASKIFPECNYESLRKELVVNWSYSIT